jgi:arginase family enzyme
MYEKFFTDLFTEEEADILVIGLPTGDNGDEYLRALRKQSWFVEIFDMYKKRNLFEKKIFDAGDVRSYDGLEKKLAEVFSKGKIPVVLTKGDIASYFACRQLKDVKVMSFDAHTDLLDDYTDEKIKWIDGHDDRKVNSSTWLKRTSEIVGLENVCVVGLRSVNEDLDKFLDENRVKYFTPRAIRNDPKKVRKEIEKFTKDSKLWLNVDVDFFDPSIAPSVDYPEPEGLTFAEFQQVVEAMRGKICGMTICGGNPSQNSVTEFITVRSMFEILSKV